LRFGVSICKLTLTIHPSRFYSSAFKSQQEEAAPAGDVIAKPLEVEVSLPAAVLPPLDESALRQAFLKFTTQVRRLNVVVTGFGAQPPTGIQTGERWV
jgi:hypothetical protein